MLLLNRGTRETLQLETENNVIDCIIIDSLSKRAIESYERNENFPLRARTMLRLFSLQNHRSMNEIGRAAGGEIALTVDAIKIHCYIAKLHAERVGELAILVTYRL